MVDFIIGVGIGLLVLLAVCGVSLVFNKGWRAGIKAFRRVNGI